MNIMVHIKTNEVMFISEQIVEEEDRYKINSHLSVLKENMVKVYTVNEISDEIEPYKYCYTEEEGFYPNPNWAEPRDMEKELDELKKQNELLKQQTDTLTECLLEMSEIVYSA